jgi:hypothetical protein
MQGTVPELIMFENLSSPTDIPLNITRRTMRPSVDGGIGIDAVNTGQKPGIEMFTM